MKGFEIEVNGIVYTGELHQAGYTYRILLWVDSIPVSFELDEERNFRALVAPQQMDKIDSEMLKSIVEELQTAFK